MPVETIYPDAHSYESGAGLITLNDNGTHDIDNAGNWIAFQFALSVTQGDTITSATLYVESTDSDGGTADIWADDSDEAAALTSTNNDISNRTPTTATVMATFDAIETKAIGVTSILQEIVDRGGFTSGNRIVVMLEGNAPSTDDAPINLGSGNNRLVVDHPGGSMSIATLVYSYRRRRTP